VGRHDQRPLRRPHIEADWAEELPVKIAGRGAVEPTEVLERVKARRWTGPPSSRWSPPWRPGPTPACEVQDELDSERLGVAMASGIGGVITLLDNYDALKEKGPAGSRRSPSRC
jgi:3-oxoacyl-[acyl-carrier-protein] synthase II